MFRRVLNKFASCPTGYLDNTGCGLEHEGYIHPFPEKMKSFSGAILFDAPSIYSMRVSYECIHYSPQPSTFEQVNMSGGPDELLEAIRIRQIYLYSFGEKWTLTPGVQLSLTCFSILVATITALIYDTVLQFPLEVRI